MNKSRASRKTEILPSNHSFKSSFLLRKWSLGSVVLQTQIQGSDLDILRFMPRLQIAMSSEHRSYSQKNAF